MSSGLYKMRGQNFMHLAIANGCRHNPKVVNETKILRGLQPATATNHQRQLERWTLFIDERQSQVAHDPAVPKYDHVESAYNVMVLKDFIRSQAYSIQGTKQLPPSQETVRNYWNTFTGAWKRSHEPIGAGIIETITEFIYSALTEELGLLREKRPRRFANGNHLTCYAEQIWAQDFHVYRRPATRVNDWALLLSNIFSTARIGEYIESTARNGSDRGLYYRDVMFICFLNDYQQPELAIQLTKDAKNMSNAPDSKRPTHALAEGDEPHTLCFNALLPFLSHFLTIGAFRDYKTIEELFAVVPPKKVRSCQIYWNDALLSTPFFLSQSKTREDRIETANAFSKRFRDLGIRAGSHEPPTQHDWRAEGLFQTDKYYTEATRMRQAAQTNREIYGTNYQPSNSGVLGAALFTDVKRRGIVTDAFREMSIPYNPNLSQRLPAMLQYKLETSYEYIGLEQEIARLQSMEDPSLSQSLRKFRMKKYKLRETALRAWQETQPYLHDAQQEYHRRIFDRVRFMMPERDRLSTNLFKEGTLRSDLGRSILSDMMALQKQRSEVCFRPGLENCLCKDQEEIKGKPDSKLGSQYDWLHIYLCQVTILTREHGFADFCFLCHKWLLGKVEWDKHCQWHISSPGKLPLHFDHLIYGGALANPGYCPFCLNDTTLEASARMKHFIYRPKWLDHVRRHLNDLRIAQEKCTEMSISCPNPDHQCPVSFQDVLHLEFHLQDIHGVDMPRRFKSARISKLSNENSLLHMERQHLKLEEDKVEEMFFIHTTTDDIGRNSHKKRKLSLDLSAPTPRGSASSSDGQSCEEEISSKTPVNDIMIDPELLRTDEVDIVEILTQTSNEGSSHCLRNHDHEPVPASPHHDSLDSLDQEEIYEVEDIVAKASIGRRVWFRIKWKGFSEGANSWVKRADVGSQAIALWNAKKPEAREQVSYEFDQIVDRKTVSGVSCYEVKLKGGPLVENLIVGVGDIQRKLLVNS